VLGATGGIGMATVQLAKALGAGTVIAATRGAKSADLARQLGADVTVDATMDNVHDGLREAVRQVTDNELGADIVVDPVGGNLSMAALRALRWSGRHVVVGFVSGEIPNFRPATYSSRTSRFAVFSGPTTASISWTMFTLPKDGSSACGRGGGSIHSSPQLCRWIDTRWPWRTFAPESQRQDCPIDPAVLEGGIAIAR